MAAPRRARAGIARTRGRVVAAPDAAWQTEPPKDAAEHLRRLVPERRRLGGKEQTDGVAGHHVEAAPARRELDELRPCVPRVDDGAGRRIEQEARELRVVGLGGDRGETPGENALDVDAVAEARPLHPHRLEGAHEHVLRHLRDERLDGRRRPWLVLLGAAAEPRVHVRDGLVVPLGREGREGELLLEDRPRDRVDGLADERAEEIHRGLRASFEAEAPRGRDGPKVARRPERQRGGRGELPVGSGEIVGREGDQGEVHPHERRQPVSGETGDEALEHHPQDGGARVLGVAPSVENVGERRARDGRRGDRGNRLRPRRPPRRRRPRRAPRTRPHRHARTPAAGQRACGTIRSTRVLKPALDRTPLSVRAPLLCRLFTWSGVAPLGAFLLVHVAINVTAIRGDAAFARAVHAVARVPALWLVEGLLVFLPLFFHGAVGLYLAVTRTPLAARSPYPNVLRAALRVTGVVAFAFVAMHLPELRFRARGAQLGAGELETLLGADLSSVSHGVPWRGVAYLIGTACVTFHFAAGLWGWPLPGTRRRRGSGVAPVDGLGGGSARRAGLGAAGRRGRVPRDRIAPARSARRDRARAAGALSRGPRSLVPRPFEFDG